MHLHIGCKKKSPSGMDRRGMVRQTNQLDQELVVQNGRRASVTALE